MSSCSKRFEADILVKKSALVVQELVFQSSVGLLGPRSVDRSVEGDPGGLMGPRNLSPGK